MNSQIAKILTGLAALMAAGAAGHAQYTFTTLDCPLGAGGSEAQGIEGTNLVGAFGDGTTVHGFLYNGSTWTTLDDPLAGFGSNQGTWAEGISGANVVGAYANPPPATQPLRLVPPPSLSIRSARWPADNTPATAWPSPRLLMGQSCSARSSG